MREKKEEKHVRSTCGGDGRFGPSKDFCEGRGWVCLKHQELIKREAFLIQLLFAFPKEEETQRRTISLQNNTETRNRWVILKQTHPLRLGLGLDRQAMEVVAHDIFAVLFYSMMAGDDFSAGRVSADFFLEPAALEIPRFGGGGVR